MLQGLLQGGGAAFETVLHLVYAHKCEPVFLGTGTQAYMHKHTHGVAHSLDAPANSYTFSSRQNSVLYHPDGCGGGELLGNGVLMSCRLRMTLGALRMVAQYLSGAQNSSLPPMLGKGCAWWIFFHTFPPQSGIKSWHLMIMN